MTDYVAGAMINQTTLFTSSSLYSGNINAGNIAAKMVQIVAGIPAYGQILTGLERPAAEISRGASAHDILGTAVIVAAQAVDRRFLYPGVVS